jgi:hypothetical protein
VPPKPKKKCCVTKPRCTRCPLRLLAEGKLPPGYTVRKRKLVKSAAGVPETACSPAAVPALVETKKHAKKGKKGQAGRKVKAGKKLVPAA